MTVCVHVVCVCMHDTVCVHVFHAYMALCVCVCICVCMRPCMCVCMYMHVHAQGVYIRLQLFGHWCVDVPELVNYVTEAVHKMPHVIRKLLLLVILHAGMKTNHKILSLEQLN